MRAFATIMNKQAKQEEAKGNKVIQVDRLLEGTWAMHRIGCQDAAKDTERWGNAPDRNEYFPTLDAAVGDIIDGEMGEQGYGIESIVILPCTKGL
jgi:hypothetical protein